MFWAASVPAAWEVEYTDIIGCLRHKYKSFQTNLCKLSISPAQSPLFFRSCVKCFHTCRPESTGSHRSGFRRYHAGKSGYTGKCQKRPGIRHQQRCYFCRCYIRTDSCRKESSRQRSIRNYIRHGIHRTGIEYSKCLCDVSDVWIRTSTDGRTDR